MLALAVSINSFAHLSEKDPTPSVQVFAASVEVPKVT